MAYGVVRTDKLMGTDVASMLESVKYMGTGSTATAIDNGCVVKVDGHITGEREIMKGVTPAATSTLDEIVLVVAPEVMYDERKRNLDEFQVAAGKPFRGYHLHSGDVFSVTADCLANASPAAGQIIELAASTKWNNVASLTSGSTKVGVIERVETAGRYTYYVIKVA